MSSRSPIDPALGRYVLLTICTADRLPCLGAVASRRCEPTPLGRVVIAAWTRLPAVLRGVRIDRFQLMPDHIHAIARLAAAGATTAAELSYRFRALSEAEARRCALWPTAPLWEPFPHVRPLPTRGALFRARRYLLANPQRSDRSAPPSVAPRAVPHDHSSA